MDFLEKDLEDIIFNSELNQLQQRGLNIDGIRKRQVKIGNYGVADIITLSRPLYHNHANALGHLEPIQITIYELKQNEINHKTLFQAYRYMAGVSQYLEGRELDFFVELVLIGKKVDKSSDFCYCLGQINNVRAYTYEYLFDGINFVEQESFTLRDKGF